MAPPSVASADAPPPQMQRRAGKEGIRVMTMAEVARAHWVPPTDDTMAELRAIRSEAEIAATDARLLTVIHGRVYDLSAWAMEHPGGHVAISTMCGHDATEPFDAYHPAYVRKLMPQYCIGVIEGTKAHAMHVGDMSLAPEPDELQRDWQALKTKMKRDGYYDTNYVWYAIKFAVAYGLFAVGMALVCMRIGWMGTDATSVVLPPLFGVDVDMAAFQHSSAAAYAVVAVSALLVGLAWQQFGFLSHDVYHSAVTKNMWLDSLLGLMFVPLVGIGGGWWRLEHNVHHIQTNSLEHDPDAQWAPVYAYSKKSVERRVWSHFHQRWVHFEDAIAKFCLKYQTWIYFPMCTMAKWKLLSQAAVGVFQRRHPIRYRVLEGVSIAVFLAWYTYLMYSLPSWTERAIFQLVSHAMHGVLVVQTTMSHWPMVYYSGHKVGTDIDGDPVADNFFAQVLATTLDYKSYWYSHWFSGGMQWQIEHHLFPRMPIHSLRHAKEPVKAIADKHGLKYVDVSFWQGNVMQFNTLNEVSRHADELSRAEVRAELSNLNKGLSMQT